MLSRSVALTAVALCASAFGCSDDPVLGVGGGADTGPRVVFEGAALDLDQINAALSAAQALHGLRDASVSAAGFAGIGVLPQSAMPGVDLYRASPGGRTSMEYDLEGDGVVETVDIFVRRDGFTYVAWRDGDRCKLAFRDGEGGWFFDAPCGDDGGLVCRVTDSLQCAFCDAEHCSECESEGRTAECPEIERPEPEPEPEPPRPDTGVDVNPDNDATDSDAGPEVGGDVALPHDTTPTPSEPVCDAECMAAPGATCCLTCGCQSGDCTPVCAREDYSWDCEVGCCFNYVTLQCDEGL